jgi:hypothetical protein
MTLQGKNRFKKSTSTLAVTALMAAASLAGLQTAASADVGNCFQFAGSVVFGAGDSISGEYEAVCSPSGSGTIYGKIMEDRSGLPDVQHDIESFYFTGSGGQSTVDTVTCQDGDDIYIEADISGLSGNDQSARRNMDC